MEKFPSTITNSFVSFFNNGRSVFCAICFLSPLAISKKKRAGIEKLFESPVPSLKPLPVLFPPTPCSSVPNHRQNKGWLE